jgi:MFS family permease
MFVLFQVAAALLFGLLALLIALGTAVWSIFIASFLVTVMSSISAPAISALVTDIARDKRLNESYGLMAIGGNLGWAIGPLTGGYLQGHASYAWVFGAGASVTALSLVAAFYLPAGTVGKAASPLSASNLRMFLSDSRMLVFGALCMLFFLETGQWGSTMSVFTIERIGFAPEQYGLLMSISGVLIVIFQYPIARKIEWLGSRRTLSLGSLLYGAGFLSLSWVRSFVPAIGSIVLMVAGEMLFVPASYAVVGRISRAEDIAKNMALLGLWAAVGSSVGPLFGGYLLDTFRTSALYVWGPVSLPAFLAAIGFVLWREYPKGDAPAAAVSDGLPKGR